MGSKGSKMAFSCTWKEQRKKANAEQLKLNKNIAPRRSMLGCPLNGRSVVAADGNNRSPGKLLAQDTTK